MAHKNGREGMGSRDISRADGGGYTSPTFVRKPGGQAIETQSYLGDGPDGGKFRRPNPCFLPSGKFLKADTVFISQDRVDLQKSEMKESGITLAIESAIAGGSLSLLSGDDEIANWIGIGRVSSAEEILPSIDSLLSRANIRREEIDMIAVAAGPGSFTGTRIGIATALGLKNGLKITMASRSSLNAVAFAAALPGRVAVVLPVGRNTVCCQEFEAKSPISGPTLFAEEDLPAFLEAGSDTSHVLHGSLYRSLNTHVPNVVDFGDNLAFAVGIACRAEPGAVESPIFLSKTF